MKNRKVILKSFYFVVILTALLCLSCEEPGPIGLILENNAAEAYRFTGNFSFVAQSFDRIIQPGGNYNFDHSNSSWYGNFIVRVFHPNDPGTELRRTTIFIPRQTERKAVHLSWDGTNFRQ
ncbi:MAG: hypothetical protein FWC36_03635 [Spirochaetes bacterium]|nr:hypothetical protein [Spirochaetota bacterium]